MSLTPDEQRRRWREAKRRWYWKHREEAIAKRRLYSRRVTNPQTFQSAADEKRLRHRAAAKRSYEKHKAKYRAQRRAAYEANKGWLYVRNARLAIQQATALRPRPQCCEVCGDDKSRIEYDHCHERGVFRGWLCSHCNIILGHARDDPDRLRKLIAYLERHRTPVAA